MKINAIWLGSWFPKTGVHLQEYCNFIKYQQIPPRLDIKKAKELHKRLGIRQYIVDNEKAIKKVKCFTESCEFTYHEDGLLTVRMQCEDLQKGKKQIESFYHGKLVPALSYLFSLGAQGMETLRKPGESKRFYICAEKVTKKDIELYFNGKEYAHKTSNNASIYFNDHLFILDGQKLESKDSLVEFIGYSIFYYEIKKHADSLLQTHRFIWDDAERLLKENDTKSTKLLDSSHALLTHANHVSNIQSRIKQILLNIELRIQSCPSNELLGFFKRSQELVYSFNYLENLFEMTEKHLRNNANYFNSAYNESQQGLLNRLQYLFLIGVVVAFITLGAFPGADFIFQDPMGQTIAKGKMISFDLKTLLIFGITTILLTIFIIIIWSLLFVRKSNTK